MCPMSPNGTQSLIIVAKVFFDNSGVLLAREIYIIVALI